MKYTSLKKQPLKSFKIRALNGGVDCENNTDGMFDGKISACKNMWYKNSRLQTRPGFKGEAESAVNAMIYGNEGELDYKVTDTVIYRSGEYCRLATAQITVDDSVHYTYVYLLDLFGNITPIGQLSFSRFSSDSFYLPTQIHFFNGKPQKNGGGIYAMVTLCDRYDVTKKNHYIYEVNSKLDEWVKVENFYIPTALTNGRGNKYQQSKNETGFSTPSPIILESQNMLEERFYSYFTSDGFSNSFKLPYSNLSNEEISCRVYYDLDKYVEWVIQPGYLRATKTFNEVEITAYIDRVTGTLYFKSETDDYSVPVMPMYSENNIKVTAAKKINNGFSKIVSASCVTRHNSKLLVAGGENGNTVFTGDYDNPLYFPYSSSVQVGEGSNKITHMSSQQGKVLVFKENELHLLTVNEGKATNEISLIRDNDKRFRTSDSFACEQISSSIGCDNNATVAVCGKHS